MSGTDEAQQRKGWAQPGNSRKYHYFNNQALSLCSNWAYWGDPREYCDSMHDAQANCAACRKVYEKTIKDGAV